MRASRCIALYAIRAYIGPLQRLHVQRTAGTLASACALEALRAQCTHAPARNARDAIAAHWYVLRTRLQRVHAPRRRPGACAAGRATGVCVRSADALAALSALLHRHADAARASDPPC